MRVSRGFTLIELLVVIAIMALLISILLPALSKARLAGRMAVSLSNQRQILTATAMYRDNFKGTLPFTLSYKRGTVKSTTSGALEGMCTWAYGGKNNDGYWAGKAFDVEAADRPLNSFMYPEQTCEAPPAPQTMDKAATTRQAFQLKGYKDPTDIVTYQRATPFPTPTYGVGGAYDDVGTSYQSNMKWLETDEMQAAWKKDAVSAWKAGMRNMALADSYFSSRFVIFNDQYADVVVNNTNEHAMIVNGYGDRNKSILGFMDGHVAYIAVVPGHGPESYSNAAYQMVFDARKIKK